MSAEIAARRNFSKIGATRPRPEIEAARTRLPTDYIVRIGRLITSSWLPGACWTLASEVACVIA